MIIQIILITAVILIGLNFLRSRHATKTKAYKKLLLILLIPCAIVVIIFPDISTTIANFVGVSRGADLLLYGLLVVIVFQFFNNYVKDKEDMRQRAIMVRKIAILEANQKKND